MAAGGGAGVPAAAEEDLGYDAPPLPRRGGDELAEVRQHCCLADALLQINDNVRDGQMVFRNVKDLHFALASHNLLAIFTVVTRIRSHIFAYTW